MSTETTINDIFIVWEIDHEDVAMLGEVFAMYRYFTRHKLPFFARRTGSVLRFCSLDEHEEFLAEWALAVRPKRSVERMRYYINPAYQLRPP